MIITLLEILSLGLIIPLVSLIVDPSFYDYFSKIKYLEISSLNYNQILIIILISITLLFLIKNCLIGILYWKQIKYGFSKVIFVLICLKNIYTKITFFILK